MKKHHDPLAALVIPVAGDDDADMRKTARAAKAKRLREALKNEDDDALADVLWGGQDDEDDDFEED